MNDLVKRERGLFRRPSDADPFHRYQDALEASNAALEARDEVIKLLKEELQATKKRVEELEEQVWNWWC